MYRTKLYWPGVYENKTTLVIPLKTEVSYSTQAFTYGGATKLVDPVTNTFTTFGSAQKIVGKFVNWEDVVYLIPSGSSLTSKGTSFEAPAQKVKYAPWTLFSGAGMGNTIHSCNITWSSNSAEDLTMGSVCAAMLECKIITSGSGFGIDAGSQFQAYKVSEKGIETQIGVFNVETPTRLTAHTYKIQAFDNVRKLDKDLCEWFNALDGWPYKAKTLADMVAEQCGLTISAFGVSEDYEVYPFTVKEGTTGRQLISWLAEAACNYCIAAADGTLVCKWYDGKSYRLKNGSLVLETSGPKIGPSSTKYDLFYYQGSLYHEDFNAADIDGFRIVESNTAKNQVEAGGNGENYYYIVGNPVVMNHPNYLDGTVYDLESGEFTEYGKWLNGMRMGFSYQKTFTPFSLKIAENLDIQVGTPVTVTDENGKTFESYITSLTWKGHRMTLECTGSRTRANANAPSTLTNKQLMDYSDTSFKRAAETTTGLHRDGDEVYADLRFLRGGIVTDRRITASDDVNTLLTPGFYGCIFTADAEAAVNMPVNEPGLLFVYNAMGRNVSAGTYVYMIQEYWSYNPATPVYKRYVRTGSTEAWSYSSWYDPMGNVKS